MLHHVLCLRSLPRNDFRDSFPELLFPLSGAKIGTRNFWVHLITSVSWLLKWLKTVKLMNTTFVDANVNALRYNYVSLYTWHIHYNSVVICIVYHANSVSVINLIGWYICVF